VAFDASNSSAALGRTITSYSWTFGDNSTGTGALTTHAYSTSGTYAVTLTVTDDVGNTGTGTNNVGVGSPPAPTANFTTSKVWLAVFCDGRTSTTQQGQTIVLYEWGFGDSTTIFTCDLVDGDGIGPGTAGNAAAGCGVSGDTISHTYAAAAIYNITLVVTDSAGRTAAVSGQITVP
jgi:PKD repeat protein